jgi:hypothetical protein
MREVINLKSVKTTTCLKEYDSYIAACKDKVLPLIDLAFQKLCGSQVGGKRERERKRRYCFYIIIGINAKQVISVKFSTVLFDR